ncbi:ribonuclease III [Candidatus Kaiserbacteria bacterium RIFCSPHIGHO2_01_FULL_48_10]|uniref:Ribonuclease 3 n=1 Tax=Candidatus Kaiserbacteria bacterium RIFCSPHIGHO2_01_FULL_48_10 TaxID=1798476 RepID=A0A1F6C6H1_9BACT|nr:MAG: ribonuclease III [Candidatus Kaiserbacteria bacterium RIFCSPHIGHO2_01_FULL_48_10]
MATDKKYIDDLATFQKHAGIAFKNETLLETAFTHRSYLNEAHMVDREHNERLEFLGDAVLELSVTAYLFKAYPAASEGDLTAYRAALVNAVMLGGIAETLGMNECLLLSKGEAKDMGRARATILANTFEAVVGALYLDQGFQAANDFIVRHVVPKMQEVIEKGAWRDAKSVFQELAQAKYAATPAYQTVRTEGPDHAKHFVVSVSVDGRVMAEGEGQSKQEAEQMAAEKALKKENT